MKQGLGSVIDQLDNEWEELVRRGTLARAVRRWADREPALTDQDASALVRKPTETSATKPDAVLAALLRCGRTDPLASRVLLQRFLPCLKRMIAATPPEFRDEWLGSLVAFAYEAIRTYPLDRRPRRIAANLASEIHRRAWATLRERTRDRSELVFSSSEVPWDRPCPPVDLSDVELADTLRWAIRRGLVDGATVRLLLLTRVGGMSVQAVASLFHEKAATLRQRRWRAERRLRAALAG